MQHLAVAKALANNINLDRIVDIYAEEQPEHWMKGKTYQSGDTVSISGVSDSED
jgi:hypothetical protein